MASLGGFDSRDHGDHWISHGQSRHVHLDIPGDAMSEEAQQMMLERMQMLEEALERAMAGVATEEDWITICHECGLPRFINERKEKCL